MAIQFRHMVLKIHISSLYGSDDNTQCDAPVAAPGGHEITRGNKRNNFRRTDARFKRLMMVSGDCTSVATAADRPTDEVKTLIA